MESSVRTGLATVTPIVMGSAYGAEDWAEERAEESAHECVGPFLNRQIYR